MNQQGLTKPTGNIDRAWAILFARLVLGLIFFMAGVMKVFQLGPLNHARKYFLPFADTFLPALPQTSSLIVRCGFASKVIFDRTLRLRLKRHL